MAARTTTATIELDLVLASNPLGRKIIALEYATRLLEAAQIGASVRFTNAVVAEATRIEAYLKGDSA